MCVAVPAEDEANRIRLHPLAFSLSRMVSGHSTGYTVKFVAYKFIVGGEIVLAITVELVASSEATGR